MIANIISSSYLLTLLYFIVTGMLVLDLFTLSNCLSLHERVIIVLRSLMLQCPHFHTKYLHSTYDMKECEHDLKECEHY